MQEPQKASLADLAVQHDSHEAAISALANAQEEIAGLRDSIPEERVGWIVISVILFDCALLLNADNSTGPIIIGILQIALLALIAKRMGVEEFYALFAKIMGKMADAASGKIGDG